MHAPHDTRASTGTTHHVPHHGSGPSDMHVSRIHGLYHWRNAPRHAPLHRLPPTSSYYLATRLSQYKALATSPPPPRLPRHRAPPDGPSSPGPRNDRPGPYPRHRALATLPPLRFQPPARALAAERSHCLDASSHHLATGHLRFPGPPPAGATRHLPHHGSGPSDIHASTTHALALSASLPGPHH